MEQLVGFLTMGLRGGYEVVKRGDDFCVSIFQDREASQYYISLVFQGHRRNAVCVSPQHDVTEIHFHAHCMRNRRDKYASAYWRSQFQLSGTSPQ